MRAGAEDCLELVRGNAAPWFLLRAFGRKWIVRNIKIRREHPWPVALAPIEERPQYIECSGGGAAWRCGFASGAFCSAEPQDVTSYRAGIEIAGGPNQPILTTNRANLRRANHAT